MAGFDSFDLQRDRDHWAELVGRVWDTWPCLTKRQQRHIRKRHPRLADALDACSNATGEHLDQVLTALREAQLRIKERRS